MDNNTEEFYERLKAELERSNSWPDLYLFKFIVPTDASKIKQIEDAFDCMGAVIKTKQSKTAKFTSVSVDVQMKNPQEIIEKYIELSTIEGIISL
ncbi:DUF493 family protein [Flavobacterium algicola]|uniref:DUF493 family protein n=1 Tax=Flavobacterium algicola TaxID=556529 RepID=UPI001EFE7886|nr:DUF493 family protein [Flavobacterium algicola]MCG9791145.1 DUF493 family protein [Flavobacterium algicola]